jgi:hypothetical protein
VSTSLVSCDCDKVVITAMIVLFDFDSNKVWDESEQRKRDTEVEKRETKIL